MNEPSITACPAVLDIIPNLIAGGACLGALFFVLIYASFSNWRKTAPGRSLMYAVASLAGLLMMNTIHLATGRYPGIQFVRIVVYTALFISIWRLVYALVQILRDGQPITLQSFIDRTPKE